MRRRSGSRRGVSVVETIFALSMITLMIILLMNLHPGILLGVRYSEQTLQAQEIAQSIIEEQLHRPFGSLQTGSRELPVVNLEGMVYRPILTIMEDPESGSTYLKGIRVKVTWNFRSQEKSLTREIWRTDVSR